MASASTPAGTVEWTPGGMLRHPVNGGGRIEREYALGSRRTDQLSKASREKMSGSGVKRMRVPVGSLCR